MYTAMVPSFVFGSAVELEDTYDESFFPYLPIVPTLPYLGGLRRRVKIVGCSRLFVLAFLFQ